MKDVIFLNMELYLPTRTLLRTKLQKNQAQFVFYMYKVGQKLSNP